MPCKFPSLRKFYLEDQCLKIEEATQAVIDAINACDAPVPAAFIAVSVIQKNLIRRFPGIEEHYQFVAGVEVGEYSGLRLVKKDDFIN